MESTVFGRHRAAFQQHLTVLEQQVLRIEETLREIDQFLDVFQPPASGKIRILFVMNNGEPVPEMRVLYRKKGGLGWHTKRVTKGWGSRSVKRSGDFEKNYETVKVLCIAAETLLADRATLMIRLRSLTSGFREAVKSASARIDRVTMQYVEPYRALFETLQDDSNP